MTRTVLGLTLCGIVAFAVVTPVSAQSDVSNKQEIEYLKQEKFRKPKSLQPPQTTPCDCSNCSAEHCPQSGGGPFRWFPPQ